MPNIAAVLKEEILRLARKEVRGQTGAVRKASAQYRKDIAEMKRRISELQHKVATLERRGPEETPSRTAEARTERVRFTAKGLRSQRLRLDLSAIDYGRLLGVTGQTVYSWEHGTSRPRRQQVARIASLRGVGKREARTRLEQLTGRGRKRSK